jgi:hypothetical protein
MLFPLKTGSPLSPSSSNPTPTMKRRAKSEQFRKSRNNYFKTGFKIGNKWDAKILVLVERNNKFSTFTNTDHQFWPSLVDIVS